MLADDPVVELRSPTQTVLSREVVNGPYKYCQGILILPITLFPTNCTEGQMEPTARVLESQRACQTAHRLLQLFRRG